jgi:hypothetical protein
LSSQFGEKRNAGCRCFTSTSGINASDPRSALYLFSFYGETGTAKYAVNTPVAGSVALPVISPLLFMSFALVSFAEKLPLKSFRSFGVLP